MKTRNRLFLSLLVVPIILILGGAYVRSRCSYGVPSHDGGSLIDTFTVYHLVNQCGDHVVIGLLLEGDAATIPAVDGSVEVQGAQSDNPPTPNDAQVTLNNSVINWMRAVAPQADLSIYAIPTDALTLSNVRQGVDTLLAKNVDILLNGTVLPLADPNPDSAAATDATDVLLLYTAGLYGRSYVNKPFGINRGDANDEKIYELAVMEQAYQSASGPEFRMRLYRDENEPEASVEADLEIRSLSADIETSLIACSVTDKNKPLIVSIYALSAGCESNGAFEQAWRTADAFEFIIDPFGVPNDARYEVYAKNLTFDGSQGPVPIPSYDVSTALSLSVGMDVVYSTGEPDIRVPDPAISSDLYGLAYAGASAALMMGEMKLSSAPLSSEQIAALAARLKNASSTGRFYVPHPASVNYELVIVLMFSCGIWLFIAFTPRFRLLQMLSLPVAVVVAVVLGAVLYSRLSHEEVSALEAGAVSVLLFSIVIGIAKMAGLPINREAVIGVIKGRYPYLEPILGGVLGATTKPPQPASPPTPAQIGLPPSIDPPGEAGGEQHIG